ncbi:MAG TPA: G1 family glutamic endopeptidase [Xanthobacteraceae bacterium]|nr:G1 family glutamic endopeptidase [Xanthobacteraceae bacterium]
MPPTTTHPDLRSGYLEEISRRAHAYPLPPADFDGLSATDAQLDQYGLPARPDQEAEPELFQYWTWLLGEPFNMVTPEFLTPSGGAPPAPVDQAGRSSRRNVPGRENSRNWSGLYIVPPRPNKFVHVVGSWLVPQPSVPPVLPEGAGPHHDEYRSSTWIGIDGHRRYPKSSMPQIGTSQFIKADGGNISVATGAWWQWWSLDAQFPPQNANNAPVPITNFPVAVGDEISAGLTVEPTGDVHFYIKNQTTGLFTTFVVLAPGPILPLGSTAEWIMERPTVVGERRMYPLPSFDEVEFRHCFARSASTIGGTLTTQRLDNARAIWMYEMFPNPHRTSFVSIPKKMSNSTFRVRYRDASAPRSGGLL